MTYGRWAIDNDHPTVVAAIKRLDLEAWITDILVDRKPSTADQRYRGMQAFFTWYESVEAGFTSPMVKMHRPKVPEQKTRVFSLEEVTEIIDAVDGSTFEGSRTPQRPTRAWEHPTWASTPAGD